MKNESSPAESAGVLLDLLLQEHPALLTLDELGAMYAGSRLDRSAARLAVEDGVTELVASGLAHRFDDFVFASRTARRGLVLGNFGESQ